MNGAGPPDRAQPLGLSMLQGRTRAQAPCPVFSCNNPKERQPTCGFRGGEGGCGWACKGAPFLVSKY